MRDRNVVGVPTLTARAYTRIKADIITCDLAPGAKVSEAELAERYGLGKAPIRAALSKLAHERLVVPAPRSGYQIASVTTREMRDIFEFRLIVEPEAARRAAGRMKVDDLRRFDAICRAGYEPGDRKSEHRFLEANRSFHIAVAEASGNQRLARAIAQVLEESERLLHLGLATRNRSLEIEHEHKQLIDALARGDRDEAGQIARQQIMDSYRMVMDAILDSDTFLDTTISF